MFRATYLLLICIVIIPTLPGIIGVMLSSFSYIPPVGLDSLSLQGYADVLNWPGISTSSLLTLFTALTSTYLALTICFAILQSLWRNKHWKRVELMLSPLLAVPHVAFAIGFAYLFAPTGLMTRIISTLFGVEFDDISTSWLVHDPYAIGLTLALALKEVPFLLLMSIPILQQLEIEKLSKVGSSLGYSPSQLWIKVVLPQWLAKMRFPLFAVVAYASSVVDFALILGPNTPPTLAMLVWQWFNDPDLQLLPRAASGAILLFILTSFLLLLVLLIEKFATHYFKRWQYSGRAGISLPGASFFGIITLLSIAIFPLMLIWSYAQRWRFPDIMPSRFSDRFWESEWPSFLPIISQSIAIALITAMVSLCLAVLAHEYRIKNKLHIPGYVVAIPMLIPQLSILFGLQIATLYVSSESYYLWVIWSHIFFAFPFVYLSLDGPWKSYNQNYTRAALSLGKSPLQTFFMVKSRLLLPSILYAWAIGASVSLAQYLPTLILGGGRIATVTTEAVALSSGFDRRVTAIYALWQALLPFVFFTTAILASRLQHKARVKPAIYQESVPNDATSRKPRHP